MDTTSVDAATARPALSVADARHSARVFLDTLVHPIAAEAADTVVLVVSELVTNALRHGGGTYALYLSAHPDGIEVAVHDRSPRPPRPARPSRAALLPGPALPRGQDPLPPPHCSCSPPKRADHDTPDGPEGCGPTHRPGGAATPHSCPPRTAQGLPR